MPEPPESTYRRIIQVLSDIRVMWWTIVAIVLTIAGIFLLPFPLLTFLVGVLLTLMLLGSVVYLKLSNERAFEGLNLREQMKPVPPKSLDSTRTQGQLPTPMAGEASSATVSPPEPVFECEDDTRVVIYGIDWDTKTIIREAPTLEELREPQANITFVWAVLARFYFQQNNRVDHTLYLSAHVWFYSPGYEFLKRVIDGIWDGNPLKRSTHIQQGRALELMVALVPIAEPNGTAGFLYSAEFADENHPGPWGDNYVVTPSLEMVAVKENEFLLKVELLPKKTSKETFPLQPFWFKLVFEPEIKLLRVPALAERSPQTPNMLSDS